MNKLLHKLGLSRQDSEERTVANLREQIQTKDARIAELRERIATKNAHIADLCAGMTELKADLEVLRGTSGDVRDAFHRLYYHTRVQNRNTYLGRPILQCPMDLHVYQEIVFRLRPRAIVQTWIFAGGSLLYFATLLDLLQIDHECLVIGIDLRLTAEARTLSHPRIRLVEGSSTDPSTIREVEKWMQSEGALISLDSDHTEPHAAQELRIYRDYVAVGSYLVVDDTNINHHPELPDFGPGPFEAVEDFLRDDDRFVRDDGVWEHNLFSFHQHGWLRKAR